MEEWSNFLSIAHDLENKAVEVETRCSYQFHTGHTADEIRYEEGLFVRVMNEIITFITASPDDASEYDSLVCGFEDQRGSDIPFCSSVKIYNEFLTLFKKYFRKKEK